MTPADRVGRGGRGSDSALPVCPLPFALLGFLISFDRVSGQPLNVGTPGADATGLAIGGERETDVPTVPARQQNPAPRHSRHLLSIPHALRGFRILTTPRSQGISHWLTLG
jgi:hypothetical protein